MESLSSTEEVERLIEKLVTSGKKILDEVEMKKLKSFCKHDDSCLEHCFHILMLQLLKEHCEVRYSAFQIIDQLFMRSHLFRTLLLNNFHQFMDSTLETDFDNPLPPPKPVADKLKEEVLMAIKRWHEKYGIAYLKLSLAVDFLKHSKQVKFNQPRPTARNYAFEEKLSRKKIVNGLKLDKLTKDMKENIWETKNVITEICNCLNLLVPLFNEDSTMSDTKSTVDLILIASNQSKKEILEGTGIPEQGYSVEIDLHKISSVNIIENNDNKVILVHLKDLINATKCIHLPRLRQWLAIAGKCGASPNIIKSLIDVKVAMQNALDKCNEMKVSNYESDDEDDDEEDFVEVPETLNEPSSSSKLKIDEKLVISDKQNLKSTNIWKPLRDEDNDLKDPTSYKYALAKQAELLEKEKKLPQFKKLQKIIPTSKKYSNSSRTVNKLMDQAPTVSFGRDLLAWDTEKYNELKSTISLSGSKEFDVGHRFYGGHSASETDNGVSDAVLSSIISRTIEFTGDFQPVNQTCRALLPNGKLCPRQDRYKCPFHGKIIPRNALGVPLCENDQPSTSTQHTVLNDTEFLKDLEENLGSGISLINKTKKQKKSENGLSDLNKIKNTSRSRLQRKVLSKKSLKRVAETMNNIDAKRNFDNFGNNFNYALH